MSSPPTRHVVVDDADPAIRYIGPGWSTASGSETASFGNFGPVYDNTLHQVSNTAGSSFQFQFSGTSVTAIGSIDNQANKTIPSWQCFLDGQLIGKTVFPQVTENQEQLCHAGSLPDGPHQLDVNVTTSGPIFYFDNIVYDPSPSVSLADAVVRVDNNDSSISLSGNGWQNRYGGLWPLTSSGGDQMTLNFIGKSVTFVGIAPGELNGNQTTGTYSIDGASPTSFIVPGHGALGQFNQLYFTTPEVAAGPHTLLITYQGSSTKAPLVLEFFYVANGTQTLPSSAPAATSVTGADTASGSSPPIGAIVGGVVGGLVLIGALLAILFFRRRRARRRPASLMIIDDPEIKPFTHTTDSFVTPYHTGPSSSHFTESDALAPASVHAPGAQPLRAGEAVAYSKAPPEKGRALPAPPLRPADTGTAPERPSMSASTSAPPSSPGTETAPAPAPRVVHHEDSGVRMGAVEAEVIDVPPTYTAD